MKILILLLVSILYLFNGCCEKDKEYTPYKIDITDLNYTNDTDYTPIDIEYTVEVNHVTDDN